MQGEETQALLPDEGPQPSSFPSALFNMINAIMGAGIVSLAYAWAKSGFIAGWIYFTFVAVVTCYTLEMVIHIADALCRDGEIDVVAYDELVERVLGRKGRWLVLWSQFLFAYGIAVGYVVIIHDELPTALQQLTHAGVFDHSVLVVIAVAVGVLLPLCMMRSVAALSKASLLCFLSSLTIIGIVAYERATQRDELCEGSAGDGSCEYDWTSLGKTSAFSVYGIFIFTKTCHHSEFQIYRSLGANATPARWKWIARLAILIVSIITSSCTMIVYSIFGDDVDSDFFKSFWKDSDVVSIGRLMFAFVILMSYPLQILVARETLQVIILEYTAPPAVDDGDNSDEESADPAAKAGAGKKKKAKQQPADIQSYGRDDVVREVLARRDDDEAGPATTGVAPARTASRASSALNRRDSKLVPAAAGGAVREDTSAALHFGTTLVLWGTTVGIGCLTDSLGMVLNLVGGIAGSCIGYILPGLVGYYSEAVTGVPAPGGKHLAFATFLLGVFTIFAVTISNFI